MVVTIVVVSAGRTLVRTDGMTGDSRRDFTWRWFDSTQEPPLASGGEPPGPLPVKATKGADAEWPGFRGPNRAASSRACPSRPTGTPHPPVEFWR